MRKEEAAVRKKAPKDTERTMSKASAREAATSYTARLF